MIATTLLALLSAGPALAGDHHLDATVGTDFPLFVGAGLTYEAPFRLQANLSGGIVPEPYVDAINWGLTTADIYSDTVADLIDVVLGNSFVLRAKLGYRPLENRGLTVAAGYQLMALSGETTDASTLIDGIEGDSASAGSEANGDIDLSISPHMLYGEVGYQWLIKERFVVRSTVGFAYTVKSSTTATPTEDPSNDIEEAAMDELIIVTEDYLDFIFEEWVHVPTVGLYVGYRFK